MAEEVKFLRFLDAVYKTAEENANAMISEIQQAKAAALRQFKKTTRENAEYTYQREMQKAKVALSAEFSHTETELKEELFRQREALTEKVFSEVKLRLQIFTKTEAYLPFLKEKATELAYALPEGAELILRPDDMLYAEEVRQAFGKECNVTADARILLGGIFARCDTLVADNTLDTAVEQQREQFIRCSGLKVIV